MKNLVTLFFAAILSLGAYSQITASEAHLQITGNTTREELGVMAQTCHENGFDFRYQPQFDEQRRLMGIKYTLATADKKVQGEGEHMMLQTEGASLILHLDKVSGTFNES
ncbi:MAG: hypothetical protein ACKOW8_10440, partial [Flavobacteriales bacterium]